MNTQSIMSVHLVAFGTALLAASAFADAKTCIWTGGAASASWSETANWKDGLAPVAGDAVTIPSGKTAPIENADNALATSLTGIEIESGATLLVTNYASDAKFAAPLTGTGRFQIWNGNGNRVELWSDNRAFTGDFSLSNTAILVKSKYALGTTNVVWFNTYPTLRRFQFNETTILSNEFHIVRTDMFEQQSASVIAGTVWAEGTDGFNFYGGSSDYYTWRVTGKIAYAGTAEAEGRIARNMDVLSGGTFDIGRLRFQCPSGTITFGGKIHTKTRSGNCFGKANFMFSDTKNTMRFTAENVFDPDVAICGRFIGACSAAYSEVIDLNGFNQRVGTLAQVTYDWKDAPNDCDPTSTLRSETPATLTILDTFLNWNDDDLRKNIYLSTVTGAASIELNSTNNPSAAGAMRFNCPGSTTTGGLICRRGTITLMPNCTFPNLTKIEATGEGDFVIQTSTVANEGKNLTVAISNLTDTVALTLDEGVVLAADKAYVGTKWLDPGTYGSAEAIALAGKGTVLPQLAGNGILTVEKYGGKTGFVWYLAGKPRP